MARIVEIVRRYPVHPDALWGLVSEWRRLQDVSQPLLKFDGLPDGPLSEGQSAEYRVSLFGKLADTAWKARILHCDPERLTYSTHEEGGPFRRWNHTMTITADECGAVMRDRVEVDAGPMNWLAVHWVRLVYSFRHAARRRLALA